MFSVVLRIDGLSYGMKRNHSVTIPLPTPVLTMKSRGPSILVRWSGTISMNIVGKMF